MPETSGEAPREPSIFERIIAGELPAAMRHEDELCVAFDDVSPAAPFHVLVVPRRRIDSINEAEAEVEEGTERLLGHLLTTAGRVAREAGHPAYRTVINTGAEAGQSVFHLHVHVLAGRKLTWPPG